MFEQVFEAGSVSAAAPALAAQALAARYGVSTASAVGAGTLGAGSGGADPAGTGAPSSPGPGSGLVLPVAAPLASLLTLGGLRRGSVVTVTGSLFLALALLAEASARGAWAAVVGVPSLGAAAVAGTGIALDRLVVIPEPGTEWADVVAVLLDAVEIVVVRPTGPLAPARARRLAARVRERRAVLVVLGAWDGAEVGLSVMSRSWQGLGAGHGRLQARQVQVRARGRGAAAQSRQLRLWLPDRTGGIGAAVPKAA